MAIRPNCQQPAPPRACKGRCGLRQAALLLRATTSRYWSPVRPFTTLPRVIPVVPFAQADRRTAWLRGTLLLATALGLMASHPLCSNTRSYPLAPICAGFPILPAPWDAVLFGVMIAALVLAAWFYRAGVITFLTMSLLAYGGDVNRGQPWLYLYWVMLLLTLFPKAVSMAGGRWALTTVYLWSGIQKCNPRFFA